MLGVIDYGMGNLGSVEKKLKRINVPFIVSGEITRLSDCDKFILPGVGHFSKAVLQIKRAGLWDFLNSSILIKKKPILGICLGMQLMAKKSEEGNENGFGWIDADVIKFRITNKKKYKVPHIGWNNLLIKKDSDLFMDVDLSSGLYYVHSYHMVCNDDSDVLAMTEYEYPFVSAILKGNIIGMQFHPEKSLDPGEKILNNFCFNY